MSDRDPRERRLLPRRACLVVPASSAKMIRRARELAVDEVILDLEDSVAPSEKLAARAPAGEALAEDGWISPVRSVRINAWSTPFALRDVIEVVERAGTHLDTIVLPKVRSAADVHVVDGVLGQLEREFGLRPGGIGLGVQIEDAEGLVNIAEILAASPRVETVCPGPGDLAADLGLPTVTVGGAQPGYPGDHWHWVMFTLLVHARANGVLAIDGPFGLVHDREGFDRMAQRSRAIGFDGKWVLHPSQIELARRIYGVDLVAFERAHDLLDAHAAAAADAGVGATLFGDEMIDDASRRMAERVVARGEAQGLIARPVPSDVAHHERAAWREAAR